MSMLEYKSKNNGHWYPMAMTNDAAKAIERALEIRGCSVKWNGQDVRLAGPAYEWQYYDSNEWFNGNPPSDVSNFLLTYAPEHVVITIDGKISWRRSR